MWVETANIVVKATIIVVLGVIAVSDFTTQKIRNRHLVYLLLAALALCSVRLASGMAMSFVAMEFGTAALLFVVLIIFWLLGKLGAGDVKLLVIIPLIVGIEGSLTFSVGLLVLTSVIFFLSKFPVFVPKRWFKTYLVGLGRTGRIPFGVPISFAAALALLIPVSLYSPAAAPELTRPGPLDFNSLQGSR